MTFHFNGLKNEFQVTNNLTKLSFDTQDPVSLH